MNVTTVISGTPAHTAFLERITDLEIMLEAWDDAEFSIIPDAPRTNYAVAWSAGGEPMAWAGWRVEDDVLLKCVDNVELRKWHGTRAYQRCFDRRHEVVVAAAMAGRPAETYLFPGNVVELHLASGWEQTAHRGESQHGHVWVKLTRRAD